MRPTIELTVWITLTLATAMPAAAQERRPREADAEAARPGRPAPAQIELPEHGVTVAMEHQLHLPVVRGTINGEGPFRFGIDTGASGQLSVSAELARKLELPADGEVTASDGTGRNVQQRALYRVAALAIGEAGFRDLQCMSGSYNRGPLGNEPIDGIIGIGLFNGLTLTLDYPDRKVRIDRGALPEPDGEEVFATHAEELVPTIDWRIGDQNVRAHIDARNMGALVVPKSLADELPLTGEPVLVGQARTQFNTIPIEAAAFDGDVRLGRHVFKTPMITFAPIFRNANIGSRVMEKFEVTIDQKNDRIRFHRDSDEPITLPRLQARPADEGSGKDK